MRCTAYRALILLLKYQNGAMTNSLMFIVIFKSCIGIQVSLDFLNDHGTCSPPASLQIKYSSIFSTVQSEDKVL